jgi:hypothetical protein
MLEQKRQFELWERNAFLILTAYFRFLWECRKTLAPQHPDDEPNDLFVEALTRIDYIEYILDEVFTKGSRDEKARFFASHSGMIREIEQRLIQRRTPYAHRNEAFYQQFAPFTPVIVGGAQTPRAA